MAALPVAMTLTSPNTNSAVKSITIPANVLFATATISSHPSFTNIEINGSIFYFENPLQGIGLKGGDILTCPSGFSVNMIAYTS